MQPTSFTCNRCNAPLTPGATQCANCGQTFAAPVPYGSAPGFMPPPTPQKSPVGLIIGLTVGFFGLIFVIGIIAAILFPVFAQAREKARMVTSASNLKAIGLATVQYAQDHKEKYPPMDSYDSFKAAIGPYVGKTDTDVFTEPGANVPYSLNSQMSNKSMEDLAAPATTVLAKETVPHMHDRICVLYADGHVTVVSSVDMSGGD